MSVMAPLKLYDPWNAEPVLKMFTWSLRSSAPALKVCCPSTLVTDPYGVKVLL